MTQIIDINASILFPFTVFEFNLFLNGDLLVTYATLDCSKKYNKNIVYNFFKENSKILIGLWHGFDSLGD